MRIAGLILARADSRRLPGKALADIGGRPMLGLVLDAVRRVRGLDLVAVATSDRPVDDDITAFATAEGSPVFRGPTEDVLGRCLSAARHFAVDGIMRVSGDSPFFEPEVADRVLEEALAHGADLTTNVAPRTFPPGWSVEVITLGALETLDRTVTEPAQREHVTTVAYRQPGLLAVRNVAADRDYPDVRLTVDTLEDLQRARWIHRQLHEGTGVVELARRYDEEQG